MLSNAPLIAIYTYLTFQSFSIDLFMGYMLMKSPFPKKKVKSDCSSHKYIYFKN